MAGAVRLLTLPFLLCLFICVHARNQFGDAVEADLVDEKLFEVPKEGDVPAGGKEDEPEADDTSLNDELLKHFHKDRAAEAEMLKNGEENALDAEGGARVSTSYLYALYLRLVRSVNYLNAVTVKRCRLCFREIERSSQCQLSRGSCTAWSHHYNYAWTRVFRDDTDNRGGGCKYQWTIQCRRN